MPIKTQLTAFALIFKADISEKNKLFNKKIKILLIP